MIPRYIRPEMGAVWTPENRFRLWFEVEAQVTDALASLRHIPEQAARVIREKGTAAVKNLSEMDMAEIAGIEEETRHDVIAFLTWLGRRIGPESRFIHQGLTSSDLLDTAFALQLLQATDILLADLDGLLEALRLRALEHKHTMQIGRSHGIHAEPLTFGLKLAGFYAEFKRDRKRLLQAREEIATCALSGAVGTYAHIDPRVEEIVARSLGLEPEPHSTQIISRDRHAVYFTTLALIAGSVERLAVEIRHLQRSEVGEVEEFFHAGQKGSSAMPHKRNPVLSENLTGLSRLIRAYSLPALEDMALWHERDISHSSVERNIAPDATQALDFALARLTGLIQDLVVYPNRMRENLERSRGLINSGEVLLAFTRAGVSREAAYRAVQEAAMETWRELGNPKGKSFLENLEKRTEVSGKVGMEALRTACDPEIHLKHIDRIFERIFREE